MDTKNLTLYAAKIKSCKDHHSHWAYEITMSTAVDDIQFDITLRDKPETLPDAIILVQEFIEKLELAKGRYHFTVIDFIDKE